MRVKILIEPELLEDEVARQLGRSPYRTFITVPAGNEGGHSMSSVCDLILRSFKDLLRKEHMHSLSLSIDGFRLRPNMTLADVRESEEIHIRLPLAFEEEKWRASASAIGRLTPPSALELTPSEKGPSRSAKRKAAKRRERRIERNGALDLEPAAGVDEPAPTPTPARAKKKQRRSGDAYGDKPSLSRPLKGDTIAYRINEMGDDMQMTLSEFREGFVHSADAGTIVVKPLGHPLVCGGPYDEQGTLTAAPGEFAELRLLSRAAGARETPAGVTGAGEAGEEAPIQPGQAGSALSGPEYLQFALEGLRKSRAAIALAGGAASAATTPMHSAATSKAKDPRATKSTGKMTRKKKIKTMRMSVGGILNKLS